MSYCYSYHTWLFLMFDDWMTKNTCFFLSHFRCFFLLVSVSIFEISISAIFGTIFGQKCVQPKSFFWFFSIYWDFHIDDFWYNFGEKMCLSKKFFFGRFLFLRFPYQRFLIQFWNTNVFMFNQKVCFFSVSIFEISILTIFGTILGQKCV